VNAARRRALAAFVIAAAAVWWCARGSGFFFVVGMQGSASANLGPLLPALCGGASAAMMLLAVDAAAGPLAGVVAAALLILSPGFLGLHRASLQGPPLLTITLLMLTVMVHAPRFSLAYGTLGAVGGVFVATEGIGLPLAAAAWALLQPARTNGRVQRVVLSLLPTAVVLWLAHLLGGAWPHGISYGWRTDLDRALATSTAVVDNQLAPIHAHPGVHIFAATAVVTLLVVGVIVGWRRSLVHAALNARVRATYPVATLLCVALIVGLLGRAVLVQQSAEPDLAAMMPITALLLLLATVTVATLWQSWPGWGRALIGLIGVGWGVAAAVDWYGVVVNVR
jgi:hypothetical protein